MANTTTSSASKVVLITGASSGIGEATARHLAAAGHTVIVGARRVDRLVALVKELTDDGYQAEYGELDVTDRDSVNAFVADALTRHGRIDVLVNNAGIMPLSLVEDVRVDEWDRMIDVNLRGVLYGIAAVLPTMRKQKSGQIINLSSAAGLRVYPNGVVYSATKFGVRAVSEGLRQESTDIRVTVVDPGLTRTELRSSGGDAATQTATEELARATGIDSSAIAAAIGYAVAQPADVDVSEIVVNPTATQL
jgi:NADP-dependent 3-hydroxy acid dehydrogenase YdfG